MEETALLEKLKDMKRNAWAPVTEEGDGELTASKFSGIPWLGKNENWPTCSNCNRPMDLFLQLNLEQLPEGLTVCKGEGLLQLFYCANFDPHCEIDCDGSAPFARSVMARLIQPVGAFRAYKASPVPYAFTPRRVLDWRREDDYPCRDELEEYNISITDEEMDLMYDLKLPLPGDKLLGWPQWIQEVDYPNCPDCSERMQYLFQIDSKCNLFYMFGDDGCGHITQCPQHPERLAFSWACD